jgi:hypothetical protein
LAGQRPKGTTRGATEPRCAVRRRTGNRLIAGTERSTL